MNNENLFNLTDALLIVSLAMHMRGHKYAIWEAAKRIKNRCDAEARVFVVDYVLKVKDPMALIKVALAEVELFTTTTAYEETEAA